MVPVLRVNVLGEPPDEQGMLENAPVGPVPGDRVVRIVGDEDEPKIQHPFVVQLNSLKGDSHRVFTSFRGPISKSIV